MKDAHRGRFVALVGDAELDEGNIYEALIEGVKHDVRNLWWVLDYNRQSLDAVSADGMFTRFDEIFRACGWRVVELKYGKKLGAALAKDKALKAWFDGLPNADLSALHYQGGGAIRARLEADLGKKAAVLKSHDDDALQALFSDLGGHCMESLVEAFDAGQRRRHADPVHRLDDQGPWPALRRPQGQSRGPDEPDSDGRAQGGDERPRRSRVGAARRARRQCPRRGRGAARARPHRPRQARPQLRQGRHPRAACTNRAEQSTQAAFGRILNDLSRAGGELADRILTTSPDVTVSTNLGAFVNQRGLFRRDGLRDIFAEAKIASTQKWASNNKGQHVELGIAENNLFLMLAAAGLAATCSASGCSRSARSTTRSSPAASMRSITPATRTRASCSSPRPAGSRSAPKAALTSRSTRRLIALGQPGLRHYEPAFADELAAMMEEAFRLIDDPDGESTYLRLSTRAVAQVERGGRQLEIGRARRRLLAARTRPMAPRRRSSPWARSCPKRSPRGRSFSADIPGLGLLTVTSPDLLHRGWTAAQARRWQRRPRAKPRRNAALPPRARRRPRHLVRRRPRLALLARRSPRPAGRALGRREIRPDRQLADLYAAYRLDGTAVTEAVAEIVTSNSDLKLPPGKPFVYASPVNRLSKRR